MKKIKLLSERTINQIAAGEVIDRPASVVKELVENSVDAGATSITVSIENGGKNLISISDNGCGISKDDLSLALERHATSKLDEDDISNIRSLGFRGEALPSIGAISNFSITSRAEGAEDAWKINVSGGTISAVEPASRAQGTLMEVRDLFMYTPVRLKFLRSDATEKNAILQWLQTFALCYPTIEFTYIADSKEQFHYLATQNIAQRIKDVFGDKMFSNLMPVSNATKGVSIGGFAGLPTYPQRSASNQFVFINGRIVKDKVVSQAIKVAYSNVMAHGSHPALVLFINIDPYELDVNVHPAKTEIRLMDQDKVRGFIIATLRRAIASNQPQTSTDVEDRVVNIASSYVAQAPVIQQNIELSENRKSDFYSTPMTFKSEPIFKMPELPDVPTNKSYVEAMSQPKPLGFAKFQIDNTYIVAESEQGLVIVDQHAAHERIVLEQMKEAGAAIKKQSLLIPTVVDLGESLTEKMLEHKDHISSFGITLERNGVSQVLVREAPVWVAHDELQELISELAEKIANEDSPDFIDAIRDEVLGNIACKSSIRAGKKLSIDEMNALLRAIENTPNASQCNHGRPTFVILKDSNLARIFER